MHTKTVKWAFLLLLIFTIHASASDALINAAKEGNKTLMRTLINQGANINYMDSGGYTPLSKAIIDWKPSAALFLLDQPGINPNKKKNGSWSCLIWSCFRMSSTGWGSYYRPVLRKLITKGAKVNYASSRGVTALMFAASSGDMEAVRLLLKAGADRNMTDSRGKKASDYARGRGHTLVYNLLTGRDSSVYMQSLFYAIKQKDTALISRLIRERRGINTREADTRRTPLMYAAMQGDLDTVRQLIDAGADMNLQDKYGRTALMDSINYTRKAVALYLIQKGADVNLRTIKDGAALCWQSNAGAIEYAASRRMVAVVDALLAAGAKVDQQGDPVWNTLFYLTLSWTRAVDLTLARKLVAAGARPNQQMIKKLRKYAGRNPHDRRLLQYMLSVQNGQTGPGSSGTGDSSGRNSGGDGPSEDG